MTGLMEAGMPRAARAVIEALLGAIFLILFCPLIPRVIEWGDDYPQAKMLHESELNQTIIEHQRKMKALDREIDALDRRLGELRSPHR